MLESISWQQFLITMAVIVGSYYIIISLLLHSRKITNILKQRSINLLSPHEDDQDDANEANHLMGSVRYENRAQQNVPREDVLTADELEIVSHESEDPIQSVDVYEENLNNDFLVIKAEINSLVEITSQGSTEECAQLFNTLLSNYPQFIGTRFQVLISQFIYDTFKEAGQHHFDLNEINSWWPQSQKQ